MKVRSLSRGSCCGGLSSLSLPLLSLLATLVYVVLFAECVEGKVRCYVCSWHSPTIGGMENMTDTCSHYNFDEAYTKTIECDLGCEATSIRKSKNDKIVNFYKNCKSESKSSSKDGCTSMEDKQYQYVTTCECSSDLCNSAPRNPRLISTGYFLTTALMLRWFTFTLKNAL